MGGDATTCDCERPDPSLEVDRRLVLLRVDATDGHPLALYASYPVHATVMPNTTDLYHADLFGFAAELARVRAGAGDEDFVAVLANAHEGDVMPRYREQSWSETRRLGRALGEQIVALHQSTDTGVGVAARGLAVHRG